MATSSGFTPRKEFLKEIPQTPNSFALLAFSSANRLRLYGFASSVITSLRRLLEQRSLILSFREDSAQNLCEFILDGKPWANSKSVATEQLILDVLSAVYRCGYSYVSTIDYGREADDRLAMAFSIPAIDRPTSRTITPSPPAILYQRDSSTTSSVEQAKGRRVPFALSFTSATLLRVISPPLHLTPSILQAVRNSWPRGVVSEKKIADNSFEFRLKGYKWFQQDTFATDSLNQILSLLTALDLHSFTLLTSISLTSRSKVKDLWIFTGPPSDDVFRPESPENASTEKLPTNSLKRQAQALHSTDHRRFATEPTPQHTESAPPSHQRSASVEASKPVHSSHQAHVLRKPAPRAQVPVSVIQEAEVVEARPNAIFRTNLPSTISTGVENMTGVGAAGGLPSPPIFYSTSPKDPFSSPHNEPSVPFPVSPQSQKPTPLGLGRPPLRPVSDRAKTPPLLTSNSPPASPSRFSPANQDVLKDNGGLLGAGVFRDSAFSSNSEISTEIPIKWTGPLNDELKPLREQLKAEQSSRPKPKNRSSSGPLFPGGWQATPIEETPEQFYSPPMTPSEEKSDQLTPIHENESRVSSPEVVRPDTGLRKSEAALVGIIKTTSPIPVAIQREKNSRKESSNSVTGGQGWVLVNVEGSPAAAAVSTPLSNSSAGSPLSKTLSAPNSSPPPVVEQASPAAQAIAVVDALDSKHRKSRSVSLVKEKDKSAVRRFFSMSKKNSNKEEENSGKEAAVAPNQAGIPRTNLRERLRLIGTPEAARRDDKRVSID